MNIVLLKDTFYMIILGFKADMRKIMLTAFKHNHDASKFFKKMMKYEIDETNPVDHVSNSTSKNQGETGGKKSMGPGCFNI